MISGELPLIILYRNHDNKFVTIAVKANAFDNA